MLRRRMLKRQQHESRQKLMFQVPVAFWWKLLVSVTSTSRKPTATAASVGEQSFKHFYWILFSAEQVHVSIELSPKKGTCNTVTALSTVEEEHRFEYGSCWSTAVQITHTKTLSVLTHQTLPAHRASAMLCFTHMVLIKQCVCGCCT